jgi:hypothetical protein
MFFCVKLIVKSYYFGHIWWREIFKFQSFYLFRLPHCITLQSKVLTGALINLFSNLC